MKRISLATAAAFVALAATTAHAVVIPNSGNNNQNNSTIPNSNSSQPTNPFNPLALPGQDFFNGLGNQQDQFLTPNIYNTQPFFPDQGTTVPQTRTVPDPIATPANSNLRDRLNDNPNVRYVPPGQNPLPNQRKWRLGVYSKDTDTGVTIAEVMRGSAADRAGLEVNDRIIAINGYQVGYVNGQLYDCSTEFERNADSDGWVTMLVQNNRDLKLLNVPVQLDSRFSKLTGSVALDNRRNLPSDAVVNVELQEVISQSSQPVTIVSSQIRNIKSYPIPFSLEYDPAVISQTGRYVVTANVVSNGREVYRTAQSTPIYNQTNPRPIALNLQQVRPSYNNTRPVQIDQEAQAAQIVTWFQQYLGRNPSDKELAAWLGAISQGYPLSQVQMELLGNSQFFARCDQNKHRYVERVHELLIGRKPTQDEMNYWVARYDAQNGIRRELAREFQDALGIH
ncbi:MAG: YbaY family lipoprotein [Planctomycetaceae bacterium]|nr:YbaY family lipoprotein [Planctomycetaceae bacterium]